MIRYGKVTDEGIEVLQAASRPTVYLDNWPLSLFSVDHTLGGRFTDLLDTSSGTLTISVVSLLEIVGRRDEKQVASTLRLLDSVDAVFIDIDPSRVIKREEELRHTDRFISHRSPCADLQLLAALADVHNPLKPFKISEIVLELQKEIKNRRCVVREDLETALFPPIEKARHDPTALSKAKERFKKKSKRIRLEFPCTPDLLNRCIDFIVINESMKMPDKEWRDVLHVIVPVAYCDFVLIDSRWVAF